MPKHTIRRTVRTAVASLAATAVVVAGQALPAQAATLAMTLSQAYGPSRGGNTVVGSVTPTAATPTPFAPNTTPVVQFQFVGTGATACTALAKAPTEIAGTGTATTAGAVNANPAAVKRITSSKIVFQVPSGSYPGTTVNATGLVLVGTQTTARWNICVYDSDSTTASTLLAVSSYTLVLKPTITSISPASSPAGGGQAITVNGTGFSAVTGGAITGSIGGVALTNITPATNGNSLTATTAARVPDVGLALTLVTPGGTVSSLNPDNDTTTSDTPIPFSYTNGITIAPDNAAAGSQVTIDVRGAGFSRFHFDAAGTPTSGLAHVFLVDGAYDSGSNRGVAECVVDMVISDTELVCSMDLSNGSIAEGAYILTVVENGSTNAGAGANPTIISSGAAFVVGPY